LFHFCSLLLYACPPSVLLIPNSFSFPTSTLLSVSHLDHSCPPPHVFLWCKDRTLNSSLYVL
jgi:hypothetical protein